MKTKEELDAIKTQVEALNKKLAELTEDELAEIVGGVRFLRPSQADRRERGIIVPTYKIDMGLMQMFASSADAADRQSDDRRLPLPGEYDEQMIVK